MLEILYHKRDPLIIKTESETQTQIKENNVFLLRAEEN